MSVDARPESPGSLRQVGLVADAGFYVGPALALGLAARGHDLVVGDPVDGLVEQLEERGARVHVVRGARDRADSASASALVEGALGAFERLDSATAFSGRVHTGSFLDSSADDPAERARIEARVPMRRLGTMEEFAAFCLPSVDGTSRFTTGQFTAYAGGWV